MGELKNILIVLDDLLCEGDNGHHDIKTPAWKAAVQLHSLLNQAASSLPWPNKLKGCGTLSSAVPYPGYTPERYSSHLTRADQSLVEYAVSLGYTVTVYDEDSMEYKSVEKSRDVNEIMEAIDAVGISGLYFYNAGREENVGWALIVVQENGAENVSDYSIHPSRWIDNWFDQYMKLQN